MAQKISVVIPNYNGRELLAKNLPQVIKNCKGAEIIVVDDASTDDSVKFIKTHFKKVKLIVQSKNMGFAKTVNRGAEEASGTLILFLNSDVSPRENFSNEAQKHFSDDKVFAVGLADYSHEAGKIVIRGRGEAEFKKGLISHFKLPATYGPSLWVSGGSGIFDRKKFQQLGGFDEVYAPFYWEDIDLCWRANKAGYVCLFEPNAKVDHFHEQGAIKKHHSDFFIKTVSWRNQFIFVWKNISDPLLLLQHLLWLPYHFAKAAINLDSAFFAGFLWAVVKIPKLILTSYEKP